MIHTAPVRPTLRPPNLLLFTSHLVPNPNSTFTGTLFGGLLVTYQDIPDYFKPVYFVSVTAVTQRALVVNDFLCCYMTYKCTDTAEVGERTVQVLKQLKQLLSKIPYKFLPPSHLSNLRPTGGALQSEPCPRRARCLCQRHRILIRRPAELGRAVPR